MKNAPHKQKNKTSETLSARVPLAVAARARARAEARGQGVSEYITDLILGADEPGNPALASLARLIQIAEATRRHTACNEPVMAELRELVLVLCQAASGGFNHDR